MFFSSNLTANNIFFPILRQLTDTGCSPTSFCNLFKLSHTNMHQYFIWFVSLFCFLPLAKSCQINQSKKFSLLSQLALSSQNKFFLRSPPKSRKKTEADHAAGLPDANLVAELDSEAETCDGLSPTGQFENCPSAGLDCAISDLVSLDSQAEVEQGIFQHEATALLCPLSCTVSQSKNLMLEKASISSPLLVFFQN